MFVVVTPVVLKPLPAAHLEDLPALDLASLQSLQAQPTFVQLLDTFVRVLVTFVQLQVTFVQLLVNLRPITRQLLNNRDPIHSSALCSRINTLPTRSAPCVPADAGPGLAAEPPGWPTFRTITSHE